MPKHNMLTKFEGVLQAPRWACAHTCMESERRRYAPAVQAARAHAHDVQSTVISKDSERVKNNLSIKSGDDGDREESR